MYKKPVAFENCNSNQGMRFLIVIIVQIGLFSLVHVKVKDLFVTGADIQTGFIS